MLSKQILCFVFFALIEFSYCYNDVFPIVSSTTQLPECGPCAEFEELKKTISSLNRRLESLEFQTEKIQKQLNDTPSQANNSSSCENVPRNCQEVLERGHQASGIYKIKPNYAAEEFSVLCNMKSQKGGWTYLLNRFDGSQNFYNNWEEYKRGFGHLEGEFWLGLENIHLLTGFEVNQLLIELVDWEDKEVYALYKLFTIGSEKEGYPLKYLQGYSGDAGDSLSNQLGMKFSTKDRDQDIWVENHCATFSKGGWWYRNCKEGHPTGVYLGKDFDLKEKLTGMFWNTFHPNTYSMKEVRMMVKPQRPGEQ